MKKILTLLLMLSYGAVWAAGAQKPLERDIPTGASSGTVEQLDLATGIVTIDGSPMALAPSAEIELRSFIREKGSPLGMPAIYRLKDNSGSRVVVHLVPMDQRETDY